MMLHPSWLTVVTVLAAGIVWGQPAPTHYEIPADVPVTVGTVTAADADALDLSLGSGIWSASHSWTIYAGDGVDTAPALSGSGPSWVSTPGDADGDTHHDAGDLAVILIEVADANGGSNLDLVRSGAFAGSWGGTDANSDHQVRAADLPSAVAVIF